MSADRDDGESLETPQRGEVMHLVRHAGEGWASAMRDHAMAPPNLGFAGRLHGLAQAAATEQLAWEEAERTGLRWRPVPGAEHAEPPYELRAGTGRRGPEALWASFDAAVAELNRAIAGHSAGAVAAAFGEVSAAAAALATAVEREDAMEREAQERTFRRGVA